MKLTDTQLVVLSAAVNHPDRRVFLPERLRGAPADKVIRALLDKRLIQPIDPETLADVPVVDIGGATPFRITDAALKALGIELTQESGAAQPEQPAEGQPTPKPEQPSTAERRKGGRKREDHPKEDQRQEQQEDQQQKHRLSIGVQN